MRIKVETIHWSSASTMMSYYETSCTTTGLEALHLAICNCTGDDDRRPYLQLEQILLL
jgi:hypothetical protein